MGTSKGKTYRRPATDEARERGNAYRRDYARRNPDKVLQWRLHYAQRLLERAAQISDGGTKGGGGNE